jgi:hypothetical protein
VSTDPAFVRAQISAAEKRAGQRQVRLLIFALIGLGVIAAFAVAGFFLAYSQARKNTGLAKEVISQSAQIKTLAEDQAKSSETGRNILKQIQDFTDPNSAAVKEQQAKIARYLALLDEAQRLGRADQLKKIAQMFEQCRSLPCDPSIVNRILAQPVPVPTFGATTPAPAPTPVAAKPSSTSDASVGTAAAPKPCPGPVVIQATPLLLPLLPPANVNVCIPASPTP